MPELPEVETTKRFIHKNILAKVVTQVIVRQPSLRYMIRPDLPQILQDQEVQAVTRRAKYILVKFNAGTLIIHLGMSGSLKITNPTDPVTKHDHCDLIFGETVLRYNDIRRFGCLVWEEDPHTSPLLQNLGIEPLSAKFNSEFLYKLTRDKNTNIKQFIMDPHNLVGVGNIYASESLWHSAIKPTRPAKTCTKAECQFLVAAIKNTLKQSIKAGGTSIRDFKGADGKLGYFVRELKIYGKEGEPCPNCGNDIKKIVLGQRASFYCLKCQR